MNLLEQMIAKSDDAAEFSRLLPDFKKIVCQNQQSYFFAQRLLSALSAGSVTTANRLTQERA